MNHKLWYYAALVMALALRLYCLGDESLWLDENHTAHLLRQGWSGITSDATQGPLFLLLEKLFTTLAGINEVGMRVLSVACGVASIAMLYRLAVLLFSPTAALWATWLATVNPVLIHISQDARPYALMIVLTITSIYYAIHLARENSAWPKAAFILSTTGILYTHAYGVFILPLIIVIWWIESSVNNISWRTYILPSAITIALFTPQLITFAERFVTKTSGGDVAIWITTPSVWHLLATPYLYFNYSPLVYTLIALLIVAALSIFRNHVRLSLLGFSVSLMLMIAFILLPWLVSVAMTPIFTFRYTSPALIGCMLILGWSLAELPKLIRSLFAFTIFGLILVPLYSYYTKLDKEPWREVAQQISAETKPGTMILADRGYIRECLENYLPEQTRPNLQTVSTGLFVRPEFYYSNHIIRVSAYSKEVQASMDSITADLHRGWTLTDSTVSPDPSDVNPHTFSWVAPITVTNWIAKEVAVK